MIAKIITKNDGLFTNTESLFDLKVRIEAGEAITVWWFTPYGHRYEEEVLFLDAADVVCVMSESHASPLEEM